MTDKPSSRAGWFDAANVHGFFPTVQELSAGWNRWLSARRAVILQNPDDTKYQNNLRQLLNADCERGACVCRETQKRAGLPAVRRLMLCADEDEQSFLYRFPYNTETEYLVEASVFLSWLIKQGLLPSKHVTAWDVAINNPVPAQNAATPAPAVAVSDGPAPLNKIVHSTKTRRDTLKPVIEQAQKQCSDPQDTAAVWAALLVLADKRTAPLIGATEDGLQYLKNGTAANFNRDALRKRLGR